MITKLKKSDFRPKPKSKRKSKSTKKDLKIQNLELKLEKFELAMNKILDIVHDLQAQIAYMKNPYFGNNSDAQFGFKEQIIPCQHRYPRIWMGVGPAPCELCGAPGHKPIKFA